MNPETRRRRRVVEQRLAASLRANLARRKAQDRTRQAIAADRAAAPDAVEVEAADSESGVTPDGSGAKERAA